MKLNAYKNTMIAALLLGASSFNVLAELNKGDVLSFSEGSNVSIEARPSFWVDAPVEANSGLIIGVAQPEKDIDAPFQLFGQATQHLSSAPIAVSSATTNTALLDFSSWSMVLKGFVISLGSGGNNKQGEGVAMVQCQSSCNKGESFTLDYSATIPTEADALGGLAYRVHMVGTIK